MGVENASVRGIGGGDSYCVYYLLIRRRAANRRCINDEITRGHINYTIALHNRWGEFPMYCNFVANSTASWVYRNSVSG